MALRIRPEYYQPTESVLLSYLFEVVYRPLLELMEEQRLNSKNAIVSALRAGTISYADGEFSGAFTSKISRTLSTFADFDRRSKTWKVRNVANVPPSITAAAVTARDEAIRITREIERSIDGIGDRIQQTIETLSFPLDAPLLSMDQELTRELGDLGVSVDMTEKLAARLKDEYTENQRLNIQNWSTQQTENLRRMVERHVLGGYRRNALREMIAQEWGVTDRKARFLARQETGLFLAAVRRERFTNAGVQRYRWSTSNDERVRDRHQELNGKVFQFGEPPITDQRTGERNEPGEDYNCRCVAIPIL